MIRTGRETCSILIVEHSDDVRAGLAQELHALGHTVTVASERNEALALEDRRVFDILVSDLVNTDPDNNPEAVRSFKISVTSSLARRTLTELRDIIEKTLAFKLQKTDHGSRTIAVREKIDLELPSDLTLMNSVLEYLVDRVDKLGLVEVEQSNLYVALDEAFVNAVKHGNRNDPAKLLRVT